MSFGQELMDHYAMREIRRIDIANCARVLDEAIKESVEPAAMAALAKLEKLDSTVVLKAFARDILTSIDIYILAVGTANSTMHVQGLRRIFETIETYARYRMLQEIGKAEPAAPVEEQPKVEAPAVYPGVGYRLLAIGEYVAPGDEIYNNIDKTWVGGLFGGWPVVDNKNAPVRRKIEG